MAKLSVSWCFSLLQIFGFLAIGSSAREEIGIYELKQGNLSVKLTNYGAHIISLVVPDKHGKLGDVLLGYDTIEEYKNDSSSFGATVGRVGNRISGAQFTLNGTLYKLIANDGKNTLHGGPKGFSKVVWTVKKYSPEGQTPHVVFAYHSFDGEQGFPGDLRAIVVYKLLGDNKMSITMKAKALNKATPVNLINHAYWNLGGHDSGDILSEEIQIFGSHYTPVDAQLIPTGKVVTVKGTPYDFLRPRTVGSMFSKLAAGYDINYALDGSDEQKLKKAAIVHDKKSGRVMEISTNQPGVQFYTSNTLYQKGKGGFTYKPHAALCLETQGFPDSVNHPSFPSQIVNPGESYKHYMLFKFSNL
ncbi:ALDOSE-1-EPIMERASE [Salix purpurea]|uniref:Aldose 1-epimerase n=1 Tax=Salix purpurea TaxID=77065 RepID=A0A9Q0URF2_SALPP|nr:ALDOSE-1-EPIMERASE [Salix purpurea]